MRMCIWRHTGLQDGVASSIVAHGSGLGGGCDLLPDLSRAILQRRSSRTIPTRESLESPESVSEDWKISPWTGDWYARADWEKERGPNFFENGVFDRRYGGDLQGVIDKLDYLSRLGHQHDLFQPGVLRAVVAQIRRQLVSPHRSIFRSRPGGRLEVDGDRKRATRRVGNGRRPTSYFWNSCRQAHARGIFG